MPPQNIADVRAAYELLRKTADDLRQEHSQVTASLAAVQEELKALPLAYLPPEDLKAGIFELIEACGQRYSASVRESIAAFATGNMRGAESSCVVSEWGKPLRFCDLEAAIEGTDPTLGRAQFLTRGQAKFDDQMVYLFFGDLIREGLKNIMAAMPAAELGYDKIHPGKIGTTRQERRQALAELNVQAVNLQQRKADLERDLREIGFPVRTDPKGKAS
jgi:hypothetical protein